MILEIIWSKISLYFGVSMPWDDDLDMESLQPLLVALPKETTTATGWFYKTIEYKERNLKRDNDNSWQPSSLGKPEMASIHIMVMRGGYLPLDQGMTEFLGEEYNVTLNDVVENLLMTRVFMKDGEYIRPINNFTHVIANDDETGFVSSEKKRFDIWCTQNKIEPNYLNLQFID